MVKILRMLYCCLLRHRHRLQLVQGHPSLGDVLMLAGLPNAAAGDERRAKLMASAEFMPKFLEGGQYALAGSVMQREIVKIA